MFDLVKRYIERDIAAIYGPPHTVDNVWYIQISSNLWRYFKKPKKSQEKFFFSTGNKTSSAIQVGSLVAWFSLN